MRTKGVVNAKYKVGSVFLFMGANSPMTWTIKLISNKKMLLP